MNMRNLLLAVVVAIALSVSLNACGKKLPDPVERKDGYAWIPIADTAFLIPEKTWLKGYGRKATDGMVSHIGVHATAPDVQPWSQAVHDQMYPKLGRGAITEIDVYHTWDYMFFHERFPKFPQSIWGGGDLIEEPSDLAEKGLRKFRERRVTDGKLQTGTVFYEYVQNGKVKYYADCDDDGARLGGDDQCHMIFPYAGKFRVTLTFRRVYMADSVRMADKVLEKLNEFEMAGRARLSEK